MAEVELHRLHNVAGPWARCYVRLTEALVSEGVPEHVAREEARMSSNLAAMWDEEDYGEHLPGCPFCDGFDEGGEPTKPE